MRCDDCGGAIVVPEDTSVKDVGMYLPEAGWLVLCDSCVGALKRGGVLTLA